MIPGLAAGALAELPPQVAVLLFLLGQHFLDARDPKMRAAPRSAADAVLEFQDEEHL